MNIIIISVLVLLALLIAFGRNIFVMLIFICLLPIGLVFYILTNLFCLIGKPRSPWEINIKLGNVLYYLYNNK